MPTIVICGTPGTGKSYLVDQLKKAEVPFDINFINLSQFAKEKGCLGDYDHALETHEIDEDKLEEQLRLILSRETSNRFVIEAIHADMVPPELVDWVFVCRADNTLLHDRLVARGYNAEKVSNNVQSEIFQTILDETRECFGESRLSELTSNTVAEGSRNFTIVLDKLINLSI